ncbi:MAG: ribonuclease D [Magnetococcales bacterium]|nr:ribonuclease D [Magnetococcales bacterium]
MSDSVPQPTVLTDDLTDALRDHYLTSQFLAVDTETLGLNVHRDRLCVVQMCDESGKIAVVQIKNYNAPNLKQVLEAQSVEKIFHFARFDIATLRHWLNIDVKPIFCTKIASRLARTYTGGHSLKYLVEEFLGIQLDKMQQSSDWAADTLSPAQIGYAASDVIHLVEIRQRLISMLERENRLELAQECMNFLSSRVSLDLAGWGEEDIFAHH